MVITRGTIVEQLGAYLSQKLALSEFSSRIGIVPSTNMTL